MKSKVLIISVSLLCIGYMSVQAMENLTHKSVSKYMNSKKEFITNHTPDTYSINVKSDKMGILDTLFKKNQVNTLNDILEKGSAEEQLDLGYKYETGEIGGTPNYEISMKLYLKAAEKGNDMAMNNIGWAYHQGLGVEPNQAKAKEWFEKAIEKGNLLAMSNLGIAYFNGMYAPEIPQDYEKALELLTLPANYGDAKAMYQMGVMGLLGLANIERTEENLQAAEKFIKLAAEQGHPLAQELLETFQGDLTNANLIYNPYERSMDLFEKGRFEEAFSALFPLIIQSDADAYYLFGAFCYNIIRNEYDYIIGYKKEIHRFYIVLLEENQDIKEAIPLPVGFNETYVDLNERIDLAFLKKAASLGSTKAKEWLEGLENNK